MLDKSLKFLKLLRDLECVERTVYRPSDRLENDVEHSYQVAVMAWFVSNQLNLSLSTEKLLKYGLVHDLIEAYAGDTPVYRNNSQNNVTTKKEREEQALNKIESEFGEFKDLIKTIKDYESKKDNESIFIYELDKILPALNLYMDNGYGWNKLGLTLDEIKKEKRAKVTTTKELIDLLEEALNRFEQEKGRLFNTV